MDGTDSRSCSCRILATWATNGDFHAIMAAVLHVAPDGSFLGPVVGRAKNTRGHYG
jgi:hypothetical protein